MLEFVLIMLFLQLLLEVLPRSSAREGEMLVQEMRMAALWLMSMMLGFRPFSQVAMFGQYHCIADTSYSDPNYAVDPLNPLFQRTPGMQKVLRASHSKRLKHKAPGSSTASVPIAAASQQGMSAELKLLVSSVKSKAPCV
jgi:hypothetical protein